MDKKLSPIDAQKILNSLQIGVVPNDNLDLLTVGRDFWLNAVKEDLNFIKVGSSKIRFVSANYGGGKTHFSMLVKQMALLENYLVSYVELNSRESPMDKFEVIFPKLMKGIVSPDNEQGLEYIFSNWYSKFNLYENIEIENVLRDLAPSLDFRAALRSYLEHASISTPESRELILSILGWIGGNKMNTRFSNITGIRNAITVANVSEIFGSFLRFIRYNGYNGLVVLLDEAEAVTSLSQSTRRNEANQNIRKLLDNADNHQGLYILFLTTPKFFDDPVKGAQSYTALWERIRSVVDINPKFQNKRSIIIPLIALEKPDLIKLSNTIIALHGLAYKWESYKSINDKLLKMFISKFLSETHESTTRLFIRELIQILDLAEQPLEMSLLEIIENLDFANI